MTVKDIRVVGEKNGWKCSENSHLSVGNFGQQALIV
jgi:hypothetical protein